MIFYTQIDVIDAGCEASSLALEERIVLHLPLKPPLDLNRL
jgi:hypothetical protein